MKNVFLIFKYIILLISILFSFSLKAIEKKFTLVIDAGHGGHDPGALGSFIYEKEINLAVALNFGEIVEENFNDVKVVYTRKTDKYLTLQERAAIVNNNHADLFISFHTNSSKASSAYGAETFTLGQSKSKANLDVAMKENSVILLEKDYETKYKGFDPNSVDSYIMFEFMQDKYIDKSLMFASNIQKQFVNFCGRSDRGVRQAEFWVLHQSACASVLVELGFISNGAEERYLSSKQGQTEMAKAVYNAFVYFKRDYDKKTGGQTVYIPQNEPTRKSSEEIKREPEKPIVSVEKPQKQIESSPKNESISTIRKNENVTQKNPNLNIVYKVQLFATKHLLSSSSPDFRGVKNADYYVEGGLNKYTLGAENNYSKIEMIRRDILSKFPDAFIIVFIDGKKLPPKEAMNYMK